MYAGLYSYHRDGDDEVDDDDVVGNDYDDEDDKDDHDDDADEDEANHLVWVMRTVALLAFSCREISAVVTVTLIILFAMMMMVMVMAIMMMMTMNMVMMMMMMRMMITWSSICWVHRGNGKSWVESTLESLDSYICQTKARLVKIKIYLHKIVDYNPPALWGGVFNEDGDDDDGDDDNDNWDDDDMLVQHWFWLPHLHNEGVFNTDGTTMTMMMMTLINTLAQWGGSQYSWEAEWWWLWWWWWWQRQWRWWWWDANDFD